MIDLTDVSELNQVLIAGYCAEFVLGWKPPDHPDTRREYALIRMYNLNNNWLNPDGKITCAYRYPDPFASADDDYAVLVYVRENWDEAQLWAFWYELGFVWSTRVPVVRPAMNYRRGDWCLAACRVVQEGTCSND